MLVYRIAHKKYAETLTVSGLEGRWNSNGKLVLYTSQSISLALLENMIYRAGFGFNHDYRIMVIEVPDGKFTEIFVKDLPKNWREVEAYSSQQKIGNSWYDKQQSLCLKVPSSVLPEDFNIILNTTHPDFSNVKLVATLDYEPDERLEKILKKYKN